MYDRILPSHEVLWSEEQTANNVESILQSMWYAIKEKDDSKWQRYVFFAPNEGLFLHNDHWVHPSVIRVLLKTHLQHIGFLSHQGEIMPAYEFAYKDEPLLPGRSFEDYMKDLDHE